MHRSDFFDMIVLGVNRKGELNLTKKKSFLILLAVLGLSALVFSQCLGSGGPGVKTAQPGQNGSDPGKSGSAASGGAKKIKAAVIMEPKEFELFSKMAKQFSDSHDGIVIEVDNVNAKEAYPKWKLAAQLGEAPDLMLLDNNWVKEFAALGFLQPVDAFYSSDQQNNRIGLLMSQVKWNGYIWGIPKNVDPYILAWSRTAAAQHKMTHAPESPAELIEWNKTMMKPEEGMYGIYADPEDPYAFIALASTLTGAWFSGDKLWGDEAAAQKALEGFLAPQEEAWTGKAYAKNYPLPTPAWSPWELLQKGKIGAMVTTVSAFKINEREDIAIAAIPAPSGKESGVWLKGKSFVISSRSAYDGLLMEWIKEMAKPETETRFWDESKMLPAQIPYSLPPLRGDKHIQSFDWLIRQGKVLPVAAETPINITALQRELQRLYKGEQNVKQFVESTGKAWIFPSKLNP